MNSYLFSFFCLLLSQFLSFQLCNLTAGPWLRREESLLQGRRQNARQALIDSAFDDLEDACHLAIRGVGVLLDLRNCQLDLFNLQKAEWHPAIQHPVQVLPLSRKSI